MCAGTRVLLVRLGLLVLRVCRVLTASRGRLALREQHLLSLALRGLRALLGPLLRSPVQRDRLALLALQDRPERRD